jgi:glycosyltransferase involved in cell wall biosynthesis
VLAPPTREQLARRWGIDAGRVRVIAPGAEILPAPDDLAGALVRLGAQPGGYLLAVGALEPRKAPDLLVRAFTRARAAGLGAQLVFAGEGRMAPALAADGVRLLGRVSDEELDVLYRGAVALVVPSLLEGYGLPLREALGRGTPAVVSDLPVYGPELDPALVRVAPGDETALADALRALGTDPELRARLAAAAPGAVSELSWASAAQLTRDVLAEAAGLAGAAGAAGVAGWAS